jgi:sugar (pentulose or hexulose) kinase
MRHVAVIDIGKTNAKLALVAADTLAEVAVVTTPNRVLPGPPDPHFDVDRLWEFVLGGLEQFQAAHGVDAISVTTHGACAALLAADGGLAAPVPDYEHPGPDSLAAAYDAIRPSFAETGSPRLPMGLNIGAQLHWMLAQDPGLRDRTAQVVTWPQYWGHRLTGLAACDPSSLGCHTDLWNPWGRTFSALAARLGLAFAPPRAASDVLGGLLPEVAARTGLPVTTPVHVGIHDSNASLLPHILGRAAPFSVVSTGTWVICMAVGGAAVALDPGRDTLVNVDARGNPVPSARFMGGREFDLAAAGPAAVPTAADIAAVLGQGVILLPAVVPDVGPFRGQAARWTPREPAPGTGQRAAAVAFMLALVTARCLSLIGHRGPAVVEGPFARNAAYLDMLAAATGGPVLAAGGVTGTGQGAALLALPDPAAAIARLPQPARRPAPDPALAGYARAWNAAAG